MKVIKSSLVIVLLLVLAVGGAQVAANRGLMPQIPALKQLPQLSSLQSLTESNSLGPLSQPTRILTSQASQLTENAGQVLGSQIEGTSDKPPLAQRAFEYSRYSYCQAAIKDYEERFGK